MTTSGKSDTPNSTVDNNARITNFLGGVSARVGKDIAGREQAALTQLALNLLEPEPVRVPPEARVVTILICDLRGFSVLANQCTADTLIALLTPFFARMTEVVHRHGGFVDKFMGDSVMALFGSPMACEDHLARALACAADMQLTMRDISAQNEATGLPEIYAGIGINTGEVMAGTFGPPQHCEFTAIGDEVNFTARIEAFSLRGQVLLSESSYQLARSDIEVAGMTQLRVKGRRGPIHLYDLAAVKRPQFIEVPRVEMRSSPRIEVDLPLRFHQVQNKRVLNETQEGNIVNLGYDGMLARLPVNLAPLSEISFSIHPDLATDESSDLYARALHTRPDHDSYRTAFAFTTAGTAGHEAVRRYVDQLIWGR